MPKYSVEFAHSIGDRVLVKEIQRPGIIKALTIDYLGPQYSVHFWNDGNRRIEWLTESEVEARP